MEFEYGDLVMGTHEVIVSMLNDYSKKMMFFLLTIINQIDQ